MNILSSILEGVVENIFNQVPILIGLIVLLGLVLQKKPFETVIGGTVRAVIGVVILQLGIEIFVNGLGSFQTIVSSAFGFEPPQSQSSLNEFLVGEGSAAPLIIACGFLLHMLFVKIFKAARYVYLTGHLMLWMSIVVAASLVEVFGSLNTWTMVGVGSLVVACYWTLQPLWIAPLLKKLLGHENFGLAHTDSTVGLLSGYGVKVLKIGAANKRDAEKMNIPKQLSFLKDINVSTALMVSLIMVIAVAFSDSAVLVEKMGDSNFLPVTWAVLEGLKLAAGIAILLLGVRMFLAEIVPAFKGISDKILPGSKPALDIPVIFPNSPTSVILGFLTSTVVFLVFMVVFASAAWFVLVPPMIMLFFAGGAGGVFGNSAGGWPGALFGGAIAGVLLAFGQWISWGLYANTAPELATLADPDWFLVGWLLLAGGGLLSALGTFGVWLLGGIFVVLTFICLLILGKKEKAVSLLVSENSIDSRENV